MEKFETVKNCPKCGKHIFFAKDEKDCFAKRRYVLKKLYRDTVKPEHLVVTCPACAYEWDETCKDAV